LESVIIYSANGGKGEEWHVEEYSEVPELKTPEISHEVHLRALSIGK
jgi:hypothetical protein